MAGLQLGASPFPAVDAFPGLSPTAGFGLTADERTLNAMAGGTIIGAPTTFQPATDVSERGKTLGWMTALTGGAVSASNDPAAWTPEEAAMQTDRALARIGQVNPELARTLAEQQGRQTEGEDEGFWGGLKKAVGTVLDITGLDTVLDYMGRASHIVPEVIHDWGKEGLIKNVGDAISGQSDVNWADVLVDNFGMERNWLTAAVGFAGDVLTDPLTYVTFGMGGLGRAAVGKTLGQATLSAGLKSSEAAPLLKMLMSAGAKDVDDAAKMMLGLAKPGSAMADDAARGLVGRVRAAMTGVHDDAASAVAFVLDNEATKTAAQNLMRQADDMVRYGTTSGFARMSAKEAAAMGVDKAAVDDVLRGWVSAGTGVGVGKPAYRLGREAAANMGGARLRLSVPIFNVRVAGWKLPLAPKRMDFSTGRRFFSGLSGQVRLQRMVGDGAATMEDMRMFWEKGYSGLKQYNPGVYNALGGRGRSIFYSASEGVGQFTKHFSAHHQVLRGGGLAAMYAEDVAVQTRHVVQQVTDEVQTVRLADGTQLRPDQVVRERLIPAAEKAAKKGQGQEYLDLLNEYANLVPGVGQRADDYYDAKMRQLVDQAAERNEPLDQAYYEALKRDRDRAIEVEKQIDNLGEDKDMGDIWRTVAKQHDEALLNAGDTPDVLADQGHLVDDLHPDDAARYSRDGKVYRARKKTAGRAIGVEDLTDGTQDMPIRGFEADWDGRQLGDPRDPKFVPANELDETIRDLTGGAGFGMFAPEAEAGSLTERLMKLREGLEADGRPGVTWAELTKGLKQEDLDELTDVVNKGRQARSEKVGVPVSRPREEFPEGALGDLAWQANESNAARAQTMTAEQTEDIIDPDIVVTEGDLVSVDYRTGGGPKEATEVVDPIKDIHDKVNPILDQMAAGDFSGLDELADVDQGVKDVFRRVAGDATGRQQQLADITTELLKKRGYKGARIVTDTGERVVLFWDNAAGTVPAARVNARAGRIATHRGAQVRGVTEYAREAIEGTGRNTNTKLITEIMRATAHLNRDEAEKLAREMLAKNNIELRQGQSFFETDAVKNLQTATDAVAKRVATRAVGKAARQAESLGLSRGAFGGGPVGMGRFRGVVELSAINMARKMTHEEEVAGRRLAAYSEEEIDRLTRVADDSADLALRYEQDLVNLVENESARLTMILDDIARQTNETVSEGLSPADITRKLEKQQVLFNRLLERGAAEGATFAPVADNIWKWDRDGQVLYFYAEDGVVKGTRSLGARMPGESHKAMRGVNALTSPAAQGQGIGSKLLHAHWDDQGIETFDDITAAISVQEFSEAGAALNRKAVQQRARMMKAEAGKKAREAKTSATKAQKELDRQLIGFREATNELQRLKGRTQLQSAKPMIALKPVANAENMEGMAALTVPGFEGFAMPEFMAQEFEFAMRGYKKLNEAHAAFRTFNGWWKSMATWLMPGFHIRNLQGAWFNNWLGGVQIRDYITAGRIRRAEREITRGQDPKWARNLIVDKDRELAASLKKAVPGGHIMGKPVEELTYYDLASLTAGLNITASNGRAFAEAKLVIESQKRRYGAKKTYFERIPAPYTKAMRGAGTMTENVFRTAAFVRGLRNGEDVMGARAFTMIRHGDYEDLTDWEYGWVRDIIPFYKWMRTNTPYQIHQLLENPAKLLGVQKAQQAVYTGMGRDYDTEKHRMPDWMGESFTIPTGREGAFNAVMLDLPMSDMFMDGREFLSSTLPTLRPILENMLGQQVYTGKPLTGESEPLLSGLTPIAGLLDAVGLVERGPNGEPYMSDKTTNLLSMMPMFSRFKNWIYEDPKREKQKWGAMMSGMLGVGMRPVDDEALTAAEMEFYYDQVEPTLNALRSKGYPLPTSTDIEGMLGSIDAAMTSLGIGPRVGGTQ